MFMSYFEKIGNTISSKTRELSQKAKAFSETSSLNNIIKAEQQKIDINYKMMGKLYFEKYGNCPAEEFSESVNAVKASLKKISQTQEQIDKIRKRNCCPECGAPFKSDAVFCSKCGAKVKEEKPQPQAVKCPNCGNRLDEGALFCDSCGTKIDAEIPLPEMPEEAGIVESVTVQPEEIQPVQEESETVEIVSTQPVQSEEQSLVKKCPSCGEVSDDPQALFCNSCGAKL